MWHDQDQTHEGELRRSELRNHLHAVVLVGAMVLVLTAVGGLLGGGMGVLFLLGLGGVVFALRGRLSGEVILRVNGASPLSRFTAPELVALVQTLAQRAGLPATPRLFLVPMAEVTAFTVGTRDAPAIAVTDGLLGTLNAREMAGVLAHEVSHVRRDDMRILGLTAAMAQATHTMALLGQFLLVLNLPLLLAGRVTVSWSAILLLLLAPALSGLIHLALSRTREYDADLGAVRITGDPGGLASALSKLERRNRSLIARLFVPIPSSPVPSLLRTHPRTEDRIRRLHRLESEGIGQPPRFHAAS